MLLVVNLFWLLSACLYNDLVVRIQAFMSPSQAVSYGAPPICTCPFWESQFLFSFKFSTCASRRLRFFSESLVLCSPENLVTPCSPEVYCESGDGPGYFDHDSAGLVFSLHSSFSIESCDPIFDQFPFRKCFHPIVDWSVTSPWARAEWSSVTQGSFPVPKQGMQYMRRVLFCWPRPALMSCFCRSDFHSVVLREW